MISTMMKFCIGECKFEYQNPDKLPLIVQLFNQTAQKGGLFYVLKEFKVVMDFNPQKEISGVFLCTFPAFFININ